MAQVWDEVGEAEIAFVTAQTWEESKRIADGHGNVLLTDVGEDLAAWHTNYRDDEDATAILEERRALKQSTPTSGANR